MNQSSQYRMIQIGRRSLIAIPQTTTAKQLSALRCYPDFTWKKAWFRRGVGLAIVSRLDRRLWKTVDSPLAEAIDFESWLARIREGLAQSIDLAVVVWPAQADRGRVYVHLLDSAGQPISFAKLSFNGLNDDRIANESKMLETFQSQNLQHLKVPSLQLRGVWQGHQYLVVEAIPPTAKSVGLHEPFPCHSVGEYAGSVTFSPKAQLEQMAWWQRFWNDCEDVSIFARTLQDTIEDGIEVCRVHGDINHTNLFRVGDKLWFVDWEQGCEYGPRLTDEICFEIDRCWPQIQANPVSSLKAFAQKYLSNRTSEFDRDAIAALAFLHAAKFPPATVLVRQWREVER